MFLARRCSPSRFRSSCTCCGSAPTPWSPSAPSACCAGAGGTGPAPPAARPASVCVESRGTGAARSRVRAPLSRGAAAAPDAPLTLSRWSARSASRRRRRPRAARELARPAIDGAPAAMPSPSCGSTTLATSSWRRRTTARLARAAVERLRRGSARHALSRRPRTAAEGLAAAGRRVVVVTDLQQRGWADRRARRSPPGWTRLRDAVGRRRESRIVSARPVGGRRDGWGSQHGRRATLTIVVRRGWPRADASSRPGATPEARTRRGEAALPSRAGSARARRSRRLPRRRRALRLLRVRAALPRVISSGCRPGGRDEPLSPARAAVEGDAFAVVPCEPARTCRPWRPADAKVRC